MDRHTEWESRLVELVQANVAREYVWGDWDCLLFAAAVVEAVTGEDLGAEHKGKYNSFASAYAYLKTLGYDSPEAILDATFDVKPTGFAHRGDLVAAADGIPMLCMGGFALSFPPEGNREGLVRVPRERWLKAWAIGEHHSSWRSA